MLGQHLDLTVWCQAAHEKGRTWEIEALAQHFRYEVLMGLRVGEDKYVNPGITRKLARNAFDAHLMSLNSSPTEMLAMRWFRARGIPFIWKSDGGFPRHGDYGSVSESKERAKRWLFPHAAAYLSSGPSCTEYLTYYGADPEGVIEYPYALRLPEDLLTPLEPDLRRKRRAEEKLAGCVFFNAGQFIHRKGLDVLLEAYAQVAKEGETSLLLIGAGSEEAHLRAMAEDLALPNVIFKPFLQRGALAEYFKLADAFVFPTRYDIYGHVVTEAMAHRLPVIATRWAGSAHACMRDGETGYIIDRDDVNTLAGRMRLLLDPEVRARMGAAGKRAIAPFTLERMAEKHVEAAARIMDLRKSVPGEAR